MSSLNGIERPGTPSPLLDLDSRRWDEVDVAEGLQGATGIAPAPELAVANTESALAAGAVTAADDVPADDWRGKLLSHGVWVVIGRVLGIVATLLSNIILARLLEPADFGNFLLIVSAAGVGSVMAMYGLNGAMLKLLGESLGLGDRQRTLQVFRLGGLVMAVSVFVFGVLAPWVVYFSIPRLGVTPVVVLAVSVAIVLIAVQQIAAESLRGMHESRWANLLTGGQISGPLTALLLIAFVVGLAAVQRVTLDQVLWLMNAGLVITMALACWVVWRVARARLSELPAGGSGGVHQSSGVHHALSMRDVLALATPLMLIHVLIFATGQSDVWIAGICFDSDSVALYGVARRLATAVGILAQVAELSVVASVVTFHAQGRLTEMQELLRTAATIAALPAVGLLAVVLLGGGPILELCFGSFYRAAAPVLIVLALGQVLATWCGACGYVLAYAGHQNVCLLTNLVATIALFVLGPLAGLRYGMLGVAWVSSGVLVTQWVAMSWLAYRLVGVRTDASLWAVGPAVRYAMMRIRGER